MKKYGMSLRCIKDVETTILPNIETGPVREVVVSTILVSGGSLVVPQQGSPVDGLKVTIPANSFQTSQTFKLSYSEIKSHDFGKFINPASPLISVSYGGGYADELMTVEVPVNIPAGHFAMGFHYNELTGELEGMPIVSVSENSITIATRHFDLSSVIGQGLNTSLKNLNISNDITKKGYFFISSIVLDELKKQTDIVSGFEPGHDDWEFPNYGSFVSYQGICSGMSLAAMWYYTHERIKGNTTLFHKYDKFTIANFNWLWQDNTLGLKVSSMAHFDYMNNSRVYEKAVDMLALDKSKDSYSWHAFAYSMLQTRQPQFVGIMSSTGGGHAMIANEVWMQDGKLWISDPNHPGNRDLVILYRDKEFEPYFAALNITDNPKNFEFIAYYGKTSNVNWKLLEQRWSELETGTIGSGVFPEIKLKVSDPTGKTSGWELANEFKTDQETIKLSIINNLNGNYSFSLFDEEGFPLLSANPELEQLLYFADLTLHPGLNIIGYCVYALKEYYDSNTNQWKQTWDWVDFRWVDIYHFRLEICPDPINAEPGREIEIKALNFRTAPIDVKYVWNFGDGTPEVIVYNDSIVRHTFANTGTFDVVVTQFNNLNGSITGTSMAKAFVGNGQFAFSLKANLWTRCIKGVTDITQGNQTTYDLIFHKDRFLTKQSYMRNGNTIVASWDGIYRRWPDMAEFKRIGTATFVVSENQQTLQFTITEEMPDLSTGISLYTWNSTISGEIPLIRVDAGNAYYGVTDAGKNDIKISIRVKRTFQDGTVCEATSFSDNSKITFTINLYAPTP
jgi:hypothetical protein